MANYDTTAVKSRYGRLPKNDAQVLAYAKAVKIIIAADGSVPDAERKAMKKGLTRLGATDEVLAEFDKFDPAKAKLEDVIGGMRKNGFRARALLRDAIEISRADGHYAAEERAAAAKAAELLGVDRAVLHQIEALVELEHAVAHLRKSLFPHKNA